MQASDWRDIATAPKDGTRVLLGHPEWWESGSWAGDRNHGLWENDSADILIPQPTHYMPIVGPKEDANAD